MSYAFGSIARNDRGGSSGQSDLMSMSDQELDAYIESQYGDQLNLDTDMLLAECGACMAQDRMHRAYFAGDATEADLMNLYSAQARGAMWGIGGVGFGAGARGLYGLYKVGREFRFGRNFRIAPFGNRTGHPTGRFPHYHRRGVDPNTGLTKPGQGIGRHRPWDSRSTDRAWWERF